MSIWCSGEHIGTDPDDGHWLDEAGNRIPPEGAERGNVLSYAEGFSNHHPDLTGTHERPAVIALSNIAPWCVPGHDEDCAHCGQQHDYPEVGAWVRLEVVAPAALNFWGKRDNDGQPTVEERHATVILDVTAATSLRDDLTEWLDRPKVTAVPEADQ